MWEIWVQWVRGEANPGQLQLVCVNLNYKKCYMSHIKVNKSFGKDMTLLSSIIENIIKD